MIDNPPNIDSLHQMAKHAHEQAVMRGAVNVLIAVATLGAYPVVRAIYQRASGKRDVVLVVPSESSGR